MNVVEHRWQKRIHIIQLSSLFLLLATPGCRSARPLSAVDLKEPGWNIRNGQAVWRLPRGKSEIAGEVLVAMRANGQSFVQFSKNPFPMVLAQATPEGWEVEFPPQNKRYAGRGAPPTRLIWLYLPRALAGKALPQGWSWHSDANGWRLENPASGEFLEGYFVPTAVNASRTLPQGVRTRA